MSTEPISSRAAIVKKRSIILPCPVAPSSPSLQYVPASKLPSSPSQPIQDEFQEEMLYFFEKEGYWGLAVTMYERAAQEHTGSSNSYWKSLVEDCGTTWFLYQYLLSLPSNVICSLIRNTITYDFHHDNEIRKFVELYMYTNISLPGIYLQVLARGNQMTQIQLRNALLPSDPDKGKWLSANELRAMLDFLKEYLGKGAVSDGKALDFDRILDSNHSTIKALIHTLTARRYSANDDQKENLEKWSRKMEEQYLDRLNPADVNTRFLRCPTEVGWSKNISRRLEDHAKNQNSTYIFGFNNAYTRFSLPDKFPNIKTFTLFRAWTNDIPHCRVGEFVGTILTSSLVNNGGLNPAAPGNIRGVKFSTGIMNVNMVNMFTRKHVRGAIAEDFKAYQERHDFVQSMTRHRQEVASEELECNDLTRQLQSLQTKVKDFKEQDGKLHSELQDLRAQALNHAIFTTMKNPLLVNLFKLIKKLRADAMGRELAISNFAKGDINVSPGLFDPDAVSEYQLTMAKLKSNTKKAFSAWKLHFDEQEEESRARVKQGKGAWNSLLTELEAYGGEDREITEDFVPETQFD